jgi:hypothetical protein
MCALEKDHGGFEVSLGELCVLLQHSVADDGILYQHNLLLVNQLRDDQKSPYRHEYLKFAAAVWSGQS